MYVHYLFRLSCFLLSYLLLKGRVGTERWGVNGDFPGGDNRQKTQTDFYQISALPHIRSKKYRVP